MENKQEICDLLLKTLRATSSARDLVSLEYSADSGHVIAKFSGGDARGINVSMNHGTEMIRNIMKNLGR